MEGLLGGLGALAAPFTGGASLLPSMITGGASLLGSIFSSDTSASNVDKQLQFAQQQQDWQTQMSNTAYQRASADMKAAGLNPMMMFGSGSAASTPSQIAAPNFNARTSPMAGIGQAAQAALQAAVTSKEMDKVSSQTANIDLENRYLRRQMGYPEFDVARGSPAYGLPEANIEATRAGAALDNQTRVIRNFDEFKGKFFNDQDDATKKALVAAGVTVDAAGKILDLVPSKAAPARAASRAAVGGYNKADAWQSSAVKAGPDASIPSATRLNSASEAAPYQNPFTPGTKNYNRTETADPGFKPGGIRERLVKQMQEHYGAVGR